MRNQAIINRKSLLLTLSVIFLIGTGAILISNQQDDLDQDIPFDVAGPMPSEKLFNVSLTCDLPVFPSTLKKVIVNEIPINNSYAEQIARNVFGFKKVDEFKNMPFDGLMLTDDNKRLEFFGLTDISYYELDSHTVVKNWSEEEYLKIANDLLHKLEQYQKYPTEVEVSSTPNVAPYEKTTSPDGTVTVNTVGVFYKTTINDIRIWGPGIRYLVEIADGRVVAARLIKKAMEYDKTTLFIKTPEEVIDEFTRGEDSVELGFQASRRTPLPEDLVLIDGMKLLHFAQTHWEPLETSPLMYQINGRIISGTGSNQTETSFTEYILATK